MNTYRNLNNMDSPIMSNNSSKYEIEMKKDENNNRSTKNSKNQLIIEEIDFNENDVLLPSPDASKYNNSTSSLKSNIKIIKDTLMLSINARLTLSLYELSICDEDIILSNIDTIVSFILTDFNDIIDYQKKLREYSIQINPILKINKNTNKDNNNNFNKHEIVNNSSNKKKITYIDEDDNDNDNDESDNDDDYYRQREEWESEETMDLPILPADQFERMECPDTVRTMVDILIVCSRFYKRTGNNLYFKKRDVIYVSDFKKISKLVWS